MAKQTKIDLTPLTKHEKKVEKKFYFARRYEHHEGTAMIVDPRQSTGWKALIPRKNAHAISKFEIRDDSVKTWKEMAASHEFKHTRTCGMLGDSEMKNEMRQST